MQISLNCVQIEDVVQQYTKEQYGNKELGKLIDLLVCKSYKHIVLKVIFVGYS